MCMVGPAKAVLTGYILGTLLERCSAQAALDVVLSRGQRTQAIDTLSCKVYFLRIH